ncbi:gliding motility-associated C-terminal domain-containing protein [Sporocytophaga myxococcoides]|uniref:T9SS type B sorting domain-containing protein n=1 Tax=Sporocytophaga myxococcoides TaxID=153721 RepID=UPI00040FA353|nr:gliding motility-associated C-terminal domain-containing protein [Sporocytophaga myxococcoides]
MVQFDPFKKGSFFFLRIVFASIFLIFTGFCNAGTFTWRNPSANYEWENPQNWVGSSGAAVPVNGNNKVVFTSTDEVIIVSSNNIPNLNSNQSVGVFRVNSGSLAISSGFALNINGNFIAAAGISITGTGGIINAGSQSIPVIVSLGGSNTASSIEPKLNLYVNSVALYRNTFLSSVYVKYLGTGSTITGGNTYSEVTTFESGGTSLFRVGNSNITGLIETFSKDVIINVTGSGGFDTYTDICKFNGNILLDNVVSTAGIRFGTAATPKGVSELASGKIISVQNFSKGFLGLSNFHQVGSTSQTLDLSGDAGIILGVNSLYDGILSCTASVVRIDGGYYNSDVNIINKGSSGTICIGTAYFNGSFTFDNQGTGTCNLSTNSGNIYTFIGTATFINSNNGTIEISYNSGSMSTFSGLAKFENKGALGSIRLGNVGDVDFKGNIELRSSSSGNIVIGNFGTINLGNSVKLSVPEDGFISGVLYLGKVIQKDVTDQEIKLTGTSTFVFYGNGVYRGKIVVESPNLNINNGTFYGVVELTKSGTSSNNSNGTVVFESDFLLNNKGTIGIGSVNTGNYTFKGNCTFNNLGTGTIYITLYGSTSTFKPKEGESNKLIKLYNAQTGSLYLGWSGIVNVDADLLLANLSTGTISLGGATINLSNDSHINIESFNSGFLSMSNVKQTQQGVSYPEINLNLTGSRFAIGGSELYSNINVTCSHLTFSSTVFHNTADFTMLGNLSTNESFSLGKNIFESTFNLTNNSIRNFSFGLNAENSGDIFKGHFILNKINSGAIYPSNLGISEYHGDITYNTALGKIPDLFGNGGGKTVFNGGNAQAINGNYTNLAFSSNGGIKIEKESNHVTLNIPLNVMGTVEFVKGNFLTVPTTFFGFSGTNQTGEGASNQSFVEGKVRRLGISAFTFPVGKSGKYRPVKISAPGGSSNTEIYVEYFNQGPIGNLFTSPLMDISECEFWNINTTVGNPFSLTLGWDADACTPINPNVISVARYVSGAWKSEGNNNVTANYDVGSVTSNVLNFLGNYNFTLGYRSKAFINTYNVNPTTYKVTAGAEKFKFPYFTSGYNGTNNGVAKIHPDLNSTSVLVDINEGSTNASYNFELQTDASSNFTKVLGKKNGTFYGLSDKLYTINNNTITFYKDGTPSNESELNILTNLEGGLVFMPSNPAPNNVFKITVPNLSNTKLEVLNASGVTVYPESNSLQWDGKDTNGEACVNGTYRFIIKVNGTVTYKGQLILKRM